MQSFGGASGFMLLGLPGGLPLFFAVGVAVLVSVENIFLGGDLDRAGDLYL